MSFKENLLQKIRIDRLAQGVTASIGPPGSGRKIDKPTMKSLLEMSPYAYRRERDLDLYIREMGDAAPRVLVLDNELPIYRSPVSDVALRKSPTVKEMVNIRNVVKILSDKDVKESQKEDSVQTVQTACLEGLDLSFSPPDIQAIAADGQTALETGDPDGVTETLSLFSELLGWSSLSEALEIGGHHIVGETARGGPGETLYGPMVLFDPRHNRIRLVKGPVSSLDKVGLDALHRVATGKEKADLEGPDVMPYLSDAVLQSTG